MRRFNKEMNMFNALNSQKRSRQSWRYFSWYPLTPATLWKRNWENKHFSSHVSFQLCLFGSDVLIRNKIEPHTISPLINIRSFGTITTYLTSLLKHSSLSHTLILHKLPLFLSLYTFAFILFFKRLSSHLFITSVFHFKFLALFLKLPGTFKD